MQKVNYHTHTQLCKHAGGTERDYVQEAVRQELKVLGFSDHAPYPSDQFGLRMEYAELEPHVQRLRELKKEYAKELDIRIGLEIEYADQEKPYYEKLLETVGIEYLLLGQHFFNDAKGALFNTYFIEKTNDTSHYMTYAKSLTDAMKTGYFAAVAHPDLFFINHLPVDVNAERACDMIIDAAVYTNTILEFNANGLRRGQEQYEDGCRHPYPHKMFWEKAGQANIEVVINSDCHSVERLWDDTVEEAYRIANIWNLKLVDTIPMYHMYAAENGKNLLK